MSNSFESALIIARAPLRISFAGGGTDLPAYYERHGGLVLSAAITRSVYAVRAAGDYERPRVVADYTLRWRGATARPIPICCTTKSRLARDDKVWRGLRGLYIGDKRALIFEGVTGVTLVVYRCVSSVDTSNVGITVREAPGVSGGNKSDI